MAIINQPGKNGKDSLAIVFDFGGVLIDWSMLYLYRPYFNNDDQSVERFITEVHLREYNEQRDRGRPYSEICAELCQKHPHYQELFHLFDVRWIETVGGPIWGTVEIVRALKSAGYTLYGLSNWAADNFAVVRRQYEFFDLFDTIVISGQEGVTKPGARIFEILLEKTGRQASECLFIDDSLANITAAQNLGFPTVQFESPEQLIQELKQRKIFV